MKKTMCTFDIHHTLLRQTSGSAHRQEAADTQLVERGARVSGLALAVAKAFRHGRERVSALRALTTLREAARSRRLSATATARMTAIRCARYLRHWKAAAERARLRSFTYNRAAAFAEKFAACAARDGMRRVLRKWAGSSRAKRNTLSAAEALRTRRQCAALRTWKCRCQDRKNAVANYSRIMACLGESRARHGLRRWYVATYGDEWRGKGTTIDFGEEDEETGRERGSIVLARLVNMAARVEHARTRRHARKALCQWSKLAKEARKRGEFER